MKEDEILLDQLDELYHKRWDKPLADMMMDGFMRGLLKGVIMGNDTAVITCLRKEIAKYSKEIKKREAVKEPEPVCHV